MSDWTARLQRVQETIPAAEETDIPEVGLDVLKLEKVTFGKTHVGRTYEEVWINHPSWIRWFYQHYKSSRNAAHRRVIMFIEKRIEEAEQEGPPDSQTPVAPRAKSLAAPKVMATRAKAKSMPAPTEEDMIEPEMIPSYDQQPMITEDRVMMHALQQRVLNMEGALQQILNHLSPPQVNAPTAATSATTTPSEVFCEWNDPWNN